MRQLKRAISLVVLSAFLFNNLSYGLGIAPASRVPVEQKEIVHALSEELLRMRSGILDQLDLAERAPQLAKEGEMKEPAVEGVSIVREAPAVMQKNWFFKRQTFWKR